MEGIIFSFGPVLLNYLSIIPENEFVQKAVFAVLIYIYTVVFLMYRCKAKVKPEKNGKQPDVEYGKAFKATIPIYIWLVIVICLAIVQRFMTIPSPPFFIFSRLVNSGLALFLVSYILYYNSIKASHPKCFPQGLLSKLFGFIGKIFDYIF